MNVNDARVSLNKFIDLLPKLTEATGRLKAVMDAAAEYERAAASVDHDRQQLMTALAQLQAQVGAARTEYEAERTHMAQAKARAVAEYEANVAALNTQYADHKAAVAADIAKAK